ncbi:MAG: hypothetical protein ACJATI_004042 [Halioglobus sp.]|jgi:hypothetical protein
MGNETAGPAPGLTTPSNPDSGQKSQFALFSDDWISLQGYIGAALELPISSGNFESKYGTFSTSKTITDCIGAMKDVQSTATEFGDPKSLRSQLITNPNLLTTAEAPTEIYTHTVWLGSKISQTAGTIASGYEYLQKKLYDMPDEKQVSTLKRYLTDKRSGPIPLADDMNKLTGELIIKLGIFEQKMNEYNEKFKAFTKESGDMMAEVNQLIGGIQTKIKDLEKSRDDAYKAWQDFTIAAVTASVGCVLIGAILAPFTGGASLAIGVGAGIAAGVGLGIKAAENRAKYNEFCKQLVTQKDDMKKKTRLRSDLGDFNKSMGLVGPSMSGFLTKLQGIQGVWLTMNNQLRATADTLSVETFPDSAFGADMLTDEVVGAWQSVKSDAKQFTAESLIDYSSLAFGDEMPALEGFAA